MEKCLGDEMMTIERFNQNDPLLAAFGGNQDEAVLSLIKCNIA